MTYASFIEVIREKLGGEAEIHRVKTRNKGTHPVIVMQLDSFNDNKIGMSIDLFDFYQDYVCYRKNLDEIVEEIKNTYIAQKYKKEYEILFKDIKHLNNYGHFKDRIHLQLLDIEMNKELLEMCVWEPFLNLALVPYIDLDNKMIIITNAIAECWRVPQAFILSEAKANTFTISNISIIEMNNLCKQLNIPIINIGKGNLYIFTNVEHTFGSALIAYDKALEYAANQLMENFWIIPASVHECFLFKESEYEYDGKAILDMVKEVNVECCRDDEILTNSVYYYDIKKKRLLLKESS